MERLLGEPCDYKGLNALALAFVGDGVFGMLVREELACKGNCSVGKLHSTSVRMVCCKAQSQAVHEIMDKLTDEEQAIYRRGRNAHTRNIPKNASVGDYHSATGLEAVFGYIYLKGDIGRLRELYRLINGGV